MRNSVALAFLLLAAPNLHGQETSSETVTVEGKKLIDTTPGPIAFNPGEALDPSHGCAEPNCGADPEDPSGGAAITQAQKDQQNKQNQEKAKSDDKVKKTIEATKDLVASVKAWFAKKFEISLHGESWKREYYPGNGGVKSDSGWCGAAHGTMGTPNPEYKSPCVKAEASPELVRRKDGVFENQVRMTYTVYNECYFEKTCGPKYYSFVAGSPSELDRLLNGVLQ